jgi:replicative DNA helicase
MSKLMKAMALKFQLPFIVIVSLRKGETGKFKRKWTDLEVEDLMGTSAIGYDADVAMVASRRDLDNKYDTNGFYVKVIKSRNMPLDYDDRCIKFKWDKTKILENEEEWVPKPDEKVEEISEEEFQSTLLDKA